jgi:glycosyltransferase involved in cell wall biosynthesis
VEIATQLGARVLCNPWPGYGRQKNFAQDHATHDWVLNLDGDEEVSPELSAEIQKALEDPGPYKGFRFPRKNFYIGRWIRFGGWYPNFLVRLAHRKFARWSEPHVHEAWVVQGPVGVLRHPLFNYSFTSIEDQIHTNLRFARLGSEDLLRRGAQPGILKLIFKPIGKFLETYFLKRGFLDGLSGFIISVNAAHSIFLKYAFLLEPTITADQEAGKNDQAKIIS